MSRQLLGKYAIIKAMYDIIREFVCQETHKFKFKIGRHIASALSGFVAGVIAASIVWLTAIWIGKTFLLF